MSTTDNTKQVTVAVKNGPDGTVLPSMLVFKGQPSGCIAKREFSTYPTTPHYCCQPNAWMDETVMMVWVDEILAPYVAMALDNIISLLIFNSYQCHMMSSVIQKINKLATKVIHIPGGCTSL
jgi:hypothetical protein